MDLAAPRPLTPAEASLHNNRAPVLRNPQDVLEVIFDLLVGSSPIDDAVSAMLRLSWVCRRWRTILLGRGRFWARVSSVIPASLLYEVLQRSGQAPLSIKTNASNSEITAFIGRQLHRAREMVVAAEGGAFMGSDRHLPGLRTLVLDLQAAPAIRDEDFFRDWSFPGLTSLTLLHANLRANTRLLSPTLTSLRLKTVRCNDADGTPGSVFFFQSIGALQALSHLHLEQAIPLDQYDIAFQPIHLPALQTIVLVDTLPSCMWFMERVDVPALESLCLDLTARIGEDDLPQFPDAFQRTLAVHSTSSEPTASVHTASFDVTERRLRLALYTREAADASILPGPTVQIIFHLNDRLHDALQLAAYLPLRDVRSVWFAPRHADMDSVFIWYGMTSVFHRARQLVLGQTTYHSATMFLGVVDFTPGSGHGPAFFPHLTSLALLNIRHGGNDSRTFGEAGPMFVDTLVDRAIMGRPITTVVIRRCRLFTECSIYKIRRLVSNVHWDGVALYIPWRAAGDEGVGGVAECIGGFTLL